jgi:hypothetical protein
MQQSDEQPVQEKKSNDPSNPESQPDLQTVAATSHSGDTLT